MLLGNDIHEEVSSDIVHIGHQNAWELRYRVWRVDVLLYTLTPVLPWPCRTTNKVNSLAPGRYGYHLQLVIFKLISRIDIFEYFLCNCPQVNATRLTSQHWCRKWLGSIRQQTITSANDDPNLCHYMALLGHNKLLQDLTPLLTESVFDKLISITPKYLSLHIRHFQIDISQTTMSDDRFTDAAQRSNISFLLTHQAWKYET